MITPMKGNKGSVWSYAGGYTENVIEGNYYNVQDNKEIMIKDVNKDLEMKRRSFM